VGVPANAQAASHWYTHLGFAVGRRSRFRIPGMSSPAPLFRPYSRLVHIRLLGHDFEVPENNSLLRCLQYLAPESISYGRFCWNQDCQYCRVTFDVGVGTPARAALSCKVEVEDGMRVTEVTAEIKYCLRAVDQLRAPGTKARD